MSIDASQQAEVQHWRHQFQGEPLDRRGYIYLIAGGGLTKIGVSTNPHRRLREVCVGDRREGAAVVWAARVAAPHMLEIGLHVHFWDQRVDGEWFCLTMQQQREAVGLIDAWQAEYPADGAS